MIVYLYTLDTFYVLSFYRMEFRIAHSDMIPTSYLSMVDEAGDTEKTFKVSAIIEKIKNKEISLPSELVRVWTK